MTTSAKVLQVLQLFSEGRTQVRAADVVARLGVSSATAYRYLGDLEAAGLIERATVSQYVLGPAIVELDRQIRENDPLISAAAEIMKSLSDRTGGTALLTRLHGTKVVCVHAVRGRHSPPHVSYERGRAMPLYRGATSKIILAHLGDDRLRELAQRDGAALRKAGLPANFEALLQAMAALREAKVCATSGEVDHGAMGWAAALRQGRHLLGSLSIVLASNGPRPDAQRIADQVLRAALRIEGRLESQR